MKTIERPAPTAFVKVPVKVKSEEPKLANNPNTVQCPCPSCGASRYTLRLMLNSAAWEDQVTARIVINNCPDCKAQDWGL
ncbi:hypothetical protein ACFLYM_01230 [Chloroflexota bacterium]